MNLIFKQLKSQQQSDVVDGRSAFSGMPVAKVSSAMKPCSQIDNRLKLITSMVQRWPVCETSCAKTICITSFYSHPQDDLTTLHTTFSHLIQGDQHQNDQIQSDQEMQTLNNYQRLDSPTPLDSPIPKFGKPEESMLTSHVSSSPVLGKFSGLPLGILGEFNTRRNKNATVNIYKKMSVSWKDPDILPANTNQLHKIN